MSSAVGDDDGVNATIDAIVSIDDGGDDDPKDIPTETTGSVWKLTQTSAFQPISTSSSSHSSTSPIGVVPLLLDTTAQSNHSSSSSNNNKIDDNDPYALHKIKIQHSDAVLQGLYLEEDKRQLHIQLLTMEANFYESQQQRRKQKQIFEQQLREENHRLMLLEQQQQQQRRHLEESLQTSQSENRELKRLLQEKETELQETSQSLRSALEQIENLQSQLAAATAVASTAGDVETKKQSAENTKDDTRGGVVELIGTVETAETAKMEALEITEVEAEAIEESKEKSASVALVSIPAPTTMNTRRMTRSRRTAALQSFPEENDFAADVDDNSVTTRGSATSISKRRSRRLSERNETKAAVVKKEERKKKKQPKKQQKKTRKTTTSANPEEGKQLFQSGDDEVDQHINSEKRKRRIEAMTFEDNADIDDDDDDFSSPKGAIMEITVSGLERHMAGISPIAQRRSSGSSASPPQSPVDTKLERKRPKRKKVDHVLATFKAPKLKKKGKRSQTKANQK